ncbi:MAG: NAD-glutamate dehydrogenase [Marinobacterium sp.]|nr:NAD-glutamate dehydrogenase [Marinobacterium sp.]
MQPQRLASKDDLLQQLFEEIDQRLPEPRSTELVEFAGHCLSATSVSDLMAWRLEDLYGSLLAFWQFIQVRQPDESRIRVFNPDHERHGWQSTHTVIEVLCTDMPFIVDSLRMELNRRNLTIHAIHNTVLTIRRDAQGQLLHMQADESDETDAVNECLVSVEVDRHTDAEQLAELQSSLYRVLDEVGAVVVDFSAMLACCQSLSDSFSGQIPGLEADEVAETRAFLDWLCQHFTFLGYDEYRYQRESGGAELIAVEGQQLGLLRYQGEHTHTETAGESVRCADRFAQTADILDFYKSCSKAQVHRPAYPDYISIKRYNDAGELVGESRFLGLFTSGVYIQSSWSIPVVRRRLDQIMVRSGLHRLSHDWKELVQILETCPRDELFQSPVDTLFETVMGIMHIHERRQIRLFVRHDPDSQLFSCLVYAPRDVYSTAFRQQVQATLCRELDCDQVEFTTYFSESILARTQYILRNGQGALRESIDAQALEQQLRRAVRRWEDDLADALNERLGEESGSRLRNRYANAFSEGYRADFNARTAVVDLQYMEQLSEQNPIQLSFYTALERPAEQLNLKLFHLESSLPLSDVLPVLENLGLRVIDERPYAIRTAERTCWIHDFNLRYTGVQALEFDSVREVFEAAFLAIWQGQACNDDFNRLVLAARINWREVAMLRGYASYMKQIRFPVSEQALSATLLHQAELARTLVALFHARFDPQTDKQHRDERQAAQEQQLLGQLDGVHSLTEDRALRQYQALIKATLRTNFYQQQHDNQKQRGDQQHEQSYTRYKDSRYKDYIAFKLAPDQIPHMPLPRPRFEIFVSSPQVEGVHLRGGKVARGGLRWSDRDEDFRTEVLGLVKAQQVKNAVIVPVGAKGGFVARQLNDHMSRDAWLAEGIACYRTFISALLDVTDNLGESGVVPPVNVVCHDGDDPYLVVAADKGTATFSDIANDIAQDYGFWLGDAFASGGSNGYDHKKMGITARGAWVSVERHFREMGLNTATDPFTVAGIGDMSGDVFGNGMLLSDQIRLVAAFNHLHIFIDPSPDPAVSYAERKRLFELPRSSWADYDASLISAGGGVFNRSAKSIRLTDQMRQLTGLQVAEVTPTELISALLTASVDLLWNGGIGTYVKASDESHSDAGDKANDVLRVDARDLRARVVGEGGNLGLTQRARMEFAAAGGRMNTDFIDNAGGVDCSDHEVNIKILLGQLVDNGDMTDKQRNQLLEDMTPAVADLVLENNYRQVQSLSLDERRGVLELPEHRRFINHLEETGRLDRLLEYLPDDEQLQQRQQEERGLTRPELSVLISYSKAELKEALAESSVPDDNWLRRELATAFPARLSRQFGEQMEQHRLRREIVATQIANHMVNFMGINAASRLQAATGAEPAVIAGAFVIARDVFDIGALWRQIEGLDYQIEASVQLEMMYELQHLMRRATRWFIRNRPADGDTCALVAQYRNQLVAVESSFGELLSGEPAAQWRQSCEHYQQAGAPVALAQRVAGAHSIYQLLGVIDVCRDSHWSVDAVARCCFRLGEALDLAWLSRQLGELEVDNYWQALAREAFRDDLEWQQQVLTAHMLRFSEGAGADFPVTERWLEQAQPLISRWRKMLDELQHAERQEYAMYTVAVRELFDLANACQWLTVLPAETVLAETVPEGADAVTEQA